jgi:hypothetical protein
MSIDVLKLPVPSRSGRFCATCRNTGSAGAEFRDAQRPQFGQQMFAPGDACVFGLPWGLAGHAPWAAQFATMVRERMLSAAADKTARGERLGPGDVVKLALAKLGYRSHAKCGCEEFRQQMNGWGWRGCLRRRKEIVEWFAAKAREQNIAVSSDALWPLIRAGLKDLLRRRGRQNQNDETRMTKRARLALLRHSRLVIDSSF